MRTLILLSVLAVALVACGPKFFPKCGEPGVNCPPCRGDEVFPDPCAARARDAGAEVGK